MLKKDSFRQEKSQLAIKKLSNDRRFAALVFKKEELVCIVGIGKKIKSISKRWNLNQNPHHLGLKKPNKSAGNAETIIVSLL